jgi:hypothetical protein
MDDPDVTVQARDNHSDRIGIGLPLGANNKFDFPSAIWPTVGKIWMAAK